MGSGHSVPESLLELGGLGGSLGMCEGTMRDVMGVKNTHGTDSGNGVSGVIGSPAASGIEDWGGDGVMLTVWVPVRERAQHWHPGPGLH